MLLSLSLCKESLFLKFQEKEKGREGRGGGRGGGKGGGRIGEGENRKRVGICAKERFTRNRNQVSKHTWQWDSAVASSHMAMLPRPRSQSEKI